MDAIPLVRSAFMDPFATAMIQIGSSPDYYLRNVRLPTQSIDDPQLLLPETPFWTLINSLAYREDIPIFGQLAAEAVPWEEVESLKPLIANSLTLHDLLVTFCAIASSQSSHVKFSLQTQGEFLWFAYCGTPLVEDDTQMELYRIVSMIQLVQIAAGSDWYPTETHLLMSASRDIESSAYLSSGRVLFSQHNSQFPIPRLLLHLPVNFKQGFSVYPATASIPSSFETVRNIDSHGVYALRQIIMSYIKLHDTNCSIDLIADICGLTVRTLQRQLASHGLNFKCVLDQARFLIAQDLLKDENNKLIDIAMQLGYSDQAHFTRAFYRWAGTSPKEFRDQLN